MLYLRYKRLTLLFIAFAVVYALQVILLPVSQEALDRYSLTETQLRLLGLTIVIPLVIIWAIALWGLLRLREYTRLIKDSPDGAAFQDILIGVFFLTLWLPLSTIFEGFASQYYMQNPDSTALMVRLVNYENVVLLAPVFYFVYRGSNKLLLVIKRRKVMVQSQRIVLAYIVFAALYVLLALMDPVRATANETVATATYYLPDWLIVSTILIPRLLMWYLGIQAVRNIYVYQKAVKGALYRLALDSLAKGLAGMIFIIIVLRCFQSLSTQLVGFGLGAILGIVFMLLIVIAASFIMIARGASRLQKIEEL